jgi:hypothetical protein
MSITLYNYKIDINLIRVKVHIHMNKDYWLFCFVNADGYYKIGKTTNVSRRVKQLKKEGPYVICFAKKTENANSKVKIIHSLLIKYRSDKGLFEIKNINTIKQLFDLVEGRWYDHTVDDREQKPGFDKEVCNEEMIRQYLNERKRQSMIDEHFKMGGSHI